MLFLVCLFSSVTPMHKGKGLAHATMLTLIMMTAIKREGSTMLVFGTPYEF